MGMPTWVVRVRIVWPAGRRSFDSYTQPMRVCDRWMNNPGKAMHCQATRLESAAAAFWRSAFSPLYALAALCLPLPALALNCETVKWVPSAEFVVKLDSSTAWQPRGGQVRIVIKSNTASVKDIIVEACFRWSGAGVAAFEPAMPVQLVDLVGDKQAVYSISVPDGALPLVPSSWIGRLWNGVAANTYPNSFDAGRIVPLADLRIMVNRPGGAAGVALAVDDLSVGITSVAATVVITVGLMLVIVGCLVWWARSRKVAGSDPLMRLITTRDGFVSLSQFQIVMWSLLFGAGAIYVMGLSGSLIDIPTGALVLLGISGVTIVGAKINEANPKAATAGAPSAPAATVRPGPVTDLAPSHENDVGVTLTWKAPAAAAGADVAYYIVRYARADMVDWRVASGPIQETGFRVTRLLPQTQYLFDVRPGNAMGEGPAVQTSATTAAAQVVTRIPAWSDLVVTPEHPGEIDVTRVQMLLFTLVAAGFVAIKLFSSYVIPEIPQGILVLMGISNGTYLSAKFVRT